MLQDQNCRNAIKEHPNTIVPWILMASYTYYHLDEPLLSDGLYEDLTKYLRDNWEFIEHRHKELCSPLRTSKNSSLFDIISSHYPQITKSAAVTLLKEETKPISITNDALRQNMKTLFD